jgi:subtilisin family serine protease
MRQLSRWILALAVAVMLIAQGSLAAQNSRAQGFERYLVGLDVGVPARALAGADALILFDWPHLSAMAVRVTPAGYARLANDPRVTYVERDELRYMDTHDNPTASGEITWGLSAVHAVEAWSTTSGEHIRVCVIDSGIDDRHPEMLLRVAESRNFNGDGQPTAQDGNGHGTHVAGTIAAALGNGGVAGVAPKVDLYIARIFDANGGGAFTSVIVNAVNWCADRADVFNMSFGSGVSSTTERNAMNSAYNKGRLLIASSGNSGRNKIGFPAAYDSVVAVGALNRNYTLADFSNYGSQQELTAPGVAVLSSMPLGTGLLAKASAQGVYYEANGLEYAPAGDVSGPLVECGLANSTSSCAPVQGPTWIALINRGSISFSEKIANVMAQGASAAILANNDTGNPDDFGSFTLGSSGTWIPTVSVSYNTGMAIRSGGLAAGTVEVGASDYGYMSGTSMASPHAAAVAALAWAAKPDLSNAQVRDILRTTATDLGSAGWDSRFGHGLVQADAAVAAAYAAGGGSGGGGGGGGGGGTPGTMNVTVYAGGAWKAGDQVLITATVTDAGTADPLVGAAVTLTISNSNNVAVASASGTTGANGSVTFRWKTNRNTLKGTYTAVAAANTSGYTGGTGSDTFTLN